MEVPKKPAVLPIVIDKSPKAAPKIDESPKSTPKIEETDIVPKKPTPPVKQGVQDLPKPMRWKQHWFGEGFTGRKLFVKGLTKWEVLEGYDVAGSDLEAIADKKMAISQCYVNPSCQGFVWSEAQGQAYLKTDTQNRQVRKPDLKLSLYVRAFEAYDDHTASDNTLSTRVVSSSDEAKEACEKMARCQAFTVDSSKKTAVFYGKTAGSVRALTGHTLYRQLQAGDVDPGTSPATLLGEQNKLPPRDISGDPPIIVGGTDGSGTRAVVTLLSNLDVLMVKDDACTFDVHAGEMGGWPPVVRRALRYSHGADYSIEDIPDRDREYLRRSLRRFADKMIAEAKRFSLLKRHVRWGFKAPISQMLLPFLYEIFPGMSFVHVLRDGRDIPFSKNQSPVDKFYFTMYKNNPSAQNLSPKLKAIKMWSDANTQVNGYMNRVQVPKGSTYLAVKIEMSVEEESLLQMGYVSNEKLELGFSKEDMCCRLRGYIRHLRKADFFQGVKSRYGKWRKKTENDPNLRRDLNGYGQVGLDLFRYNEEPNPPLYEVPSFRVCDGVEERETCEFDFPSKCIESPNIR